MTTYMFVDCHYLCYRAFHTTGNLMYEGAHTGIAFGFLRELDRLIDLHMPDITVFTFDSGGKGLRGEMYPEYKANRKERTERTEEKKVEYLSFREQVNTLRTKILPRMGYRNIFRRRGYEADDIMAYYAERIDSDDFGIIVTADNDLWQCVNDNVMWYNPSSHNYKIVTRESFIKEWNIDPVMWANVKALAGCTSDNIKGVKWIGEKSAAKWFAGTLKSDSSVYKKISDDIDIHNRNIKLTKLPLEGIELPELRLDAATEKRKMKVHMELGIRPKRQVSKKQKSDGFDFEGEDNEK